MRVLYADDHLLVVDKPVGVLTLAHGYEPGVPHVRILLEPEWGPVWPVYTLEKEVSGLLVLARSKGIQKALARQSREGALQRMFHALVRGVPEWETYTARHPLRTNVGRRKRTVVDPDRGHPAETVFRVVERFERHALVEAIPRTEWRHQIRVHLYTLGHPLVGESLYGTGPAEDDPLPRLALHARRVVFRHPVSGEVLRFTAEYPEDWIQTLAYLRMEREFPLALRSHE